jgi:hypothetical protein
VRPELPYLGAGALAITGGAIRDGRWPDEGVKAVIGTVALVIAASATADTRIAPLVQAVGLLLLMASVMAVVKATQKKGK